MPEDSRHRASNLDDKLAAEIEAALGDMSLEDMTDLMESPAATSRARPASGLRSGVVVAVHGDDVFIEFGPKSQGVCPLGQFEQKPEVGQRLEFIVDRYDDREGLLMLSRRGAVRKAAWESLEIGQVVEARCTGVNKGGLEMEVARHPAFMPAGQVDRRHIQDLSVYIGQKIPCEVIELNRQRGRIILSRRNVQETERQHLREKLLGELEVGRRMPAVISSLQPYGAFADLGGLDGLIHISDLSYQHVRDPAEVVSEGDQVEVQILKLDLEQDPPRISLGMKQCMADPFQSKAGELAEGDTITGRVTKIMPFGAFVEIAPGVEGLIHISQLSRDRVASVGQVLKVDQIVNARVLDVDRQRQRISLSLRALQEEQAATDFRRQEDPAIRKLKAKFGDGGDRPLKGGIG